jgi:hypothetical protein
MRFWMRYTCCSSFRQGSSRQAPLISFVSVGDDVFLSAILLTLHLPYSRVYVCISVTLHDGVGFLDHPLPCDIGWNLLAFSTCLQESTWGSPVPSHRLSLFLGLHSTPDYFLCESESIYEQLAIVTGYTSRSPFIVSILDQASQSVQPVVSNDASNMHSLRSHDSQLAGVAASDLQLTHISSPLSRLMSSRYRRAGAIDAHIVGEGLRLTSMTQLSRHYCLAVHPPLNAVVA